MRRSILAALSIIAIASTETPAFGYFVQSGAVSQIINAEGQERINARNSRADQEHYETLNS